MKINNIADYARECSIIIARYVDGEFWFYGATNDSAEAERIASAVDGEIFENYFD